MAVHIETKETKTKTDKKATTGDKALAKVHDDGTLQESARRYEAPLADIYEGDGGWMLQLDVPGVTKKDVDLRFDKDVLTVRADRGADRGYMRSFGIPKDVAVSDIGATLEDGVLTITLPKVPAAKPLTIKVK